MIWANPVVALATVTLAQPLNQLLVLVCLLTGTWIATCYMEVVWL